MLLVDVGSLRAMQRWLESHPTLDERVQRIYGRRMQPLPLTPVHEPPESAPRTAAAAPGGASLASLVDPFARF